MKYFKIIKDGEFIGAITSDNFICYVDGCGYMCTNEQFGEYAIFGGKYYRTSWMKTPHTAFPYTEASILPITEDEYLILKQAIDTNEEIVIDDDEGDDAFIYHEDEDETSIDFVRESKLMEINAMCRRTIEDGFDLQINGAIKHFSLSTQDQLNLINLGTIIETQELVPYHADGEEVTFYSADEIKSIINTANTFKTYQTTYCNALKIYVNALETIQDITAVTYGMNIPPEYQTDVLKALGGN